MRFAPLLVTFGCSFSASLGADAPPMFDDSGREIRKWNFDASTDFAAGQLVDMTVDPRGSLTPNGYVYGALLARGVQGMKLWSNTDANWDHVASLTSLGLGLWTGNDLDVPGEQLRFVGITNTSMVTVWMEGEVWLSGGETIRVMGDDTAFAYVAMDRKTFTKIAHQSMGVVTVAAAGWYPIRVGWADGNNSGGLEFDITDPVGGGIGGARHDRFRVATSALRGTFRNVYYREVHGGGIPGAPPVMSIHQTPLHAATTFDPPLPGSVTTSAMPFDWSARWTGQFYAAAEGSYTIQVDSNDGSRITLGTAAPVAQKFARDDNGAVVTVATANLVAGWNDLIVDFNHVDGTPSFAVRVMAAPAGDVALVGAPIPVERLRPVEPRSDRLITRSVTTNGQAVQDDANVYVDRNVRIDAHPTEIVTSLAITARVESQRVQQLTYRLTAPNNTTQIRDDLIETADGNLAGSFIIYGVWDLGGGLPAGGTWKFGVADNSSSGGSNTTTYEEVHVTMHTRGGPDQVATKSAWFSPVVENETAVSVIDFVNWKERVPSGASVSVRLRTCAMTDCSDGVWSEPIVNGTAPTLPPNRYIQAQIEMTSDGTHEPEVESLDVQYRTDKK